MVKDVPHPSIPTKMPSVHLEVDMTEPAIVGVEESKEHMDFEADNNGNLTDIT